MGLSSGRARARPSFSLKFVDRRTGDRERHTLGYHPSIGLAEARPRAKSDLPLSTQAAQLFSEASTRAGACQRRFDAAERRTVSCAIALRCKHVGLTGDQAATPHDLRRTISTWLGDKMILGHSPQGPSRGNPQVLQSQPASRSGVGELSIWTG
jgi:hypothetical protein